MATIKLKFRPSTVEGSPGRLYYQIIHRRKVRQLTTEYSIYPTEWNPKREIVIPSPDANRKSLIASIREKIRWDVERLIKIGKTFEQNGLPYTADDIIDEYNRHAQEYTLFNFMESVIASLKCNGKTRTAETYHSALNSFKKFRDGEDIMLDQVSSELMEAYESWLKQRGVINNTISFYTRILRAVYNRAVEKDIIENRNPFRHVYTGVDKTVKRALSIATIKKIKHLDLSLCPSLDYARDMFLMSFYLRGMSFVDMAFLKKVDLKNGSVTYRRRKTGQSLVIGWTKEMQMILDKYAENATEYLLPIITKTEVNERYTYRNKGYNINRNLKKIAKIAKIEINLTLYVARHSWASAAKAKGIPLSVISEGMGHDSETTTQIYLASLDTSVVDEANELIISGIE